jgi:predicted ATP-grasp superfamily ATP-dependent carboligase
LISETRVTGVFGRFLARLSEVSDLTLLQLILMPISLNVRGNSFRNCTLMTGFHGIGSTGYIAISYLIHSLRAERIGFVDVAHPPPFVSTSEDGLVTPFEVYRKGKLVFVKLEFAPHRAEEAEFAKELARWTITGKFKDAVLIGGLDSNLKSGDQNVRIVPTRAYLNRKNGFKYPTLEPGLFVYGQLAVMLSEFEIHNFPAIAILPYASATAADPAAAAVAVRTICKAYSVKVDVSDLEDGAKEIEEEFEKRMKQTSKSLRSMYG